MKDRLYRRRRCVQAVVGVAAEKATVKRSASECSHSRSASKSVAGGSDQRVVERGIGTALLLTASSPPLPHHTPHPADSAAHSRPTPISVRSPPFDNLLTPPHPRGSIVSLNPSSPKTPITFAYPRLAPYARSNKADTSTSTVTRPDRSTATINGTRPPVPSTPNRMRELPIEGGEPTELGIKRGGNPTSPIVPDSEKKRQFGQSLRGLSKGLGRVGSAMRRDISVGSASTLSSLGSSFGSSANRSRVSSKLPPSGGQGVQEQEDHEWKRVDEGGGVSRPFEVEVRSICMDRNGRNAYERSITCMCRLILPTYRHPGWQL